LILDINLLTNIFLFIHGKDYKEKSAVIGYSLAYTYACNEYCFSKKDVYENPKNYPKQLSMLYKATDKLRESFENPKERKRNENLVAKCAVDYIKSCKSLDNESIFSPDIIKCKLSRAVKEFHNQ